MARAGLGLAAFGLVAILLARGCDGGMTGPSRVAAPAIPGDLAQQALVAGDASPSAFVEKAAVIRGIRYVTAERLNLRAGPSPRASVLAGLARQTRLEIRDATGGWLQVSTPDGQTGWVYAEFTSTALPVASPPQITKSTRTAPNRSDVIDAIIETSISAYPGACPCPYNTMRNGRSCGRNSAWSKPGGASPICYPSDVSDQMIARFR